MNSKTFLTSAVLLSLVGLSIQAGCGTFSYAHRLLHNPNIEGYPDFRLKCKMMVSVCSGGCFTEHKYKLHRYTSGSSTDAHSFCNIQVQCCEANTQLQSTSLYDCKAYSGTEPPSGGPYGPYTKVVEQATSCQCRSCISASSVSDCDVLHA